MRVPLWLCCLLWVHSWKDMRIANSILLAGRYMPGDLVVSFAFQPQGYFARIGPSSIRQRTIFSYDFYVHSTFMIIRHQRSTLFSSNI
ncbi:hypothetical protein GGR57DRAFT_469279 [Xylariaceae sp. FL1272]|nr:hypothetical protein GGR57DRAFT_469279 [Xylariaceae sp. FL1272]